VIEKIDRDEKVISGLTSAFDALTGRGGRLTGHGGAASGQSLVSSWSDWTCPVRADRTQIESGRRLPGKLKRMTRRGGGVRDRTRWSNSASGRASGHRSKRRSLG
jgi:hypothetical protein